MAQKKKQPNTEHLKELDNQLKEIFHSIPAQDLWSRSADVERIKGALKSNNEYYKKGVIDLLKNNGIPRE